MTPLISIEFYKKGASEEDAFRGAGMFPDRKIYPVRFEPHPKTGWWMVHIPPCYLGAFITRLDAYRHVFVVRNNQHIGLGHLRRSYL